MSAKPLSHLNQLGQRLRLEMKRSGLSSADLAKRADVKTSFLYDIVSGKSANPSTLKLARVAKALGIDLESLVGDNKTAAAKSKEGAATDYVIIPRIMVDFSTAGGFVVSREYEEERYYFRRNWITDHLGASPETLRMLYVCGDSMEPTLCHNDIVLVDTSKKTPSPPGVFVLFDGFGLVAKRLEPAGDEAAERLRIISDNPQYSTYERAIDETFVIGRVVWFAREM